MSDDAEYMLDCDGLNAESQALLSQTKNDYWHKEQEQLNQTGTKTMTKDAIFKKVTAERLTIRIETRVELEYNEVYAVIFDRRGDELFEATYPGLNDMEAIQDVYRQFRRAKREMEQIKP